MVARQVTLWHFTSLDRQVQSVIRLCWLKLYPSPRTNKNQWAGASVLNRVFVLFLDFILFLIFWSVIIISIILPAFRLTTDFSGGWYVNTGGCCLADIRISQRVNGDTPAGARVRRASLSSQTRQCHGVWIDWPLTSSQKWPECILYSIQIHVFVFVVVTFFGLMIGRVNGSKDYVARHHDTILVVSVSSCDLVTAELHIVKWVWQWWWMNQHQELFLLFGTWPKWDHRTCVS